MQCCPTLFRSYCAARQSPFQESRSTQQAIVLIQINPHCREIVEISAEAKTRARTLEGLHFGTSRGILIVRPLFADTRVRSKTANRHLRNDYDFRRDCSFGLVARRSTLEVLRHLHVIAADPSPFTEHFVQTI